MQSENDITFISKTLRPPNEIWTLIFFLAPTCPITVGLSVRHWNQHPTFSRPDALPVAQPTVEWDQCVCLCLLLLPTSVYYYYNNNYYSSRVEYVLLNHMNTYNHVFCTMQGMKRARQSTPQRNIYIQHKTTRIVVPADNLLTNRNSTYIYRSLDARATSFKSLRTTGGAVWCSYQTQHVV